MWRLLPVLLLVSCAVNDEKQPASGEHQPDQGRIVRLVELPVQASAQTINGEPSRKNFQTQGIQGWLDETGAWHIEAEVHHGRLRCGTYETGIQLGRGNPACSDVEWLTGVESVTRQRHCNSATRSHRGGGRFSEAPGRLEEVTCVRLVVRCEGTC